MGFSTSNSKILEVQNGYWFTFRISLILLLISLENVQMQNTGLKYYKFYLKATHVIIPGLSNKELT